MLAQALTECRDHQVTGALYLAGSPGGVVHLRDGLVVAVESPGAPGLDVLLLRSGRLSEEDWSAALRVGPSGPYPSDELLIRSGVGCAELQLVATMATQDSAFVIVAGTIEEYALDRNPFDVLLPIASGLETDELLSETARREAALASLEAPVSPHRDQLARVAGAAAEDMPSAARRDIFTNADGRRCARDIAFRMGRNVFPVVVEVARMIGDGLIEVVAKRPVVTAHPDASLRPLAPAAEPGAGDEPAKPLPRREPRPSPVPRAARAYGWQVLPRLLNRIRAGPEDEAREPD
ncbi:hypothetical protein SAMN05421504_101693 [Amycolatopsis xylanica]|uniref:Uncharacterized protein n=1 Tax=Amycolatopsis xylanica TaxID=589385 RepID=A0A1H2TV90_9PSEU|nr:hypothetical protein SAMN05421504_101693 [Amycolatopsis xylanica]